MGGHEGSEATEAIWCAFGARRNSTVETDKCLNADNAFKLLFVNDSRDLYSFTMSADLYNVSISKMSQT